MGRTRRGFGAWSAEGDSKAKRSNRNDALRLRKQCQCMVDSSDHDFAMVLFRQTAGGEPLGANVMSSMGNVGGAACSPSLSSHDNVVRDGVFETWSAR